MKRTLIVGGGVAGLTLAYALSRAGTEVTLLEAERFGAGASGAPLALLNPHRGRSARASDLDLAGLEVMRRWHGDLTRQGLGSGVTFGGVLRLAVTAKQARQWRQRSAEQPAARWLEPAAVPESYRAPHGGLLIEGGWLEPGTFLGTLAEAARRQGAEVRESSPVRGLRRRKPGFEVLTRDASLPAARVILCLGTGRLPGLELPGLEQSAGDVIGLQPSPDAPYPVAGSVYGAQRGNTFWLGGNHRPVGASDSGAAAQLHRSGGYFLPALAQAERISHWQGVRGQRPDRQPLLAELEPDLWYLGAFGGRGFLCAALLAERLAHRLTS